MGFIYDPDGKGDILTVLFFIIYTIVLALAFLWLGGARTTGSESKETKAQIEEALYKEAVAQYHIRTLKADNEADKEACEAEAPNILIMSCAEDKKELYEKITIFE